MTLMTSDVMRRQLRRPFHKTSSKIVLKGGLHDGIDAYFPKGSTLEATTVIFSSEICSTFTAMSSRTTYFLIGRHSVKYVIYVYFLGSYNAYL
jgi:hypothetical protein